MLERLICAVFGHRYVVERVLNHGARKVGCTRCGRHWGMHDGTRSFVPWDGELEAMYAQGGILEEASSDVPRRNGLPANVAGNRLAEGKSELTGLLGHTEKD